MKFISVFLLSILSMATSYASPTFSWSVNDSLSGPESAYYVPELKLIFISNVNGAPNAKDANGFISILKKNGKMLNTKWLTGLNAPKGMRYSNGSLWVSDIDELVQININNGKITNKYKVEGAKFLNDIAISGAGDIYVSDMLTSKIHVLRNGNMETFVAGEEYELPNGLLIVNDELYVAGWGKGIKNDFSTDVLGHLYKINLESKKKTLVTKKPLGNLDGLEVDKNGNFLVSDWVAGLVYRVKPDGSSKVIFKWNQSGTADIGYQADSDTLLIPLMNDNQVMAKRYP